LPIFEEMEKWVILPIERNYMKIYREKE